MTPDRLTLCCFAAIWEGMCSAFLAATWLTPPTGGVSAEFILTVLLVAWMVGGALTARYMWRELDSRGSGEREV